MVDPRDVWRVPDGTAAPGPGSVRPGDVRTWARQEATERVSARYGRFYPPLAVAALVLGMFAPFEDQYVIGAGQDGAQEFESAGDATIGRSFGSLFDMASRRGGAPAVLALLLMGSLIIMLCVAAVRVESVALPVAIAGVSAVIVSMYVTKPATGNPPPALSDGGRAGLALAIAICGLGLVHTVDLILSRRR